MSKSESSVEEEAVTSKKVFDAFRDEFADKQAEQPNVDDGGIDKSGQHFSVDVVQSLDNIVDVKKTGDEKMNETILSDSQLTILDEMLPSLNAYQREIIVKLSSKNHEEESHDENLDDKKSENIVEDQSQKENIGLSSKSLVHAKVELGTEEQVRTLPNTQEVSTDKQRDEHVWPDSQNAIPDEFLPSLSIYKRKSIIIHPSANRELQTPIQKLRIRRPFKFKESPYTDNFGSRH
ncbi:hypothetical protein FXO37_24526 [Capsicum annuum]|nr:hypothetical protein FXO37_24526 [Capsicum annuum]